jgi:hypothetical protein
LRREAAFSHPPSGDGQSRWKMSGRTSLQEARNMTARQSKRFRDPKK